MPGFPAKEADRLAGLFSNQPLAGTGRQPGIPVRRPHIPAAARKLLGHASSSPQSDPSHPFISPPHLACHSPFHFSVFTFSPCPAGLPNSRPASAPYKHPRSVPPGTNKIIDLISYSYLSKTDIFQHRPELTCNSGQPYRQNERGTKWQQRMLSARISGRRKPG